MLLVIASVLSTHAQNAILGDSGVTKHTLQKKADGALTDSIMSGLQSLSPAQKVALINLIQQVKQEPSATPFNSGTEPSKSKEDSIKTAKENQWKGHVEFGGYVEAYYIFDINQPKDNNRSSFIYSHNRHNEFNINLAYAKMSYVASRLHANVALMAGTYTNANLAAEPGVLKNLLEANAGINLSDKKQVWLDAGIFASHIGFESARGMDCWNMTRSILADNSPYYESGVKLTYTSDNGKIMASGLILNGWQRIQRVSGNSLPSFGWQIQGKPNDKFLINSSSFIGTDKPDSSRLMRYFHNLYAVITPTTKLGFIVGLDAGMEQKAKGSKEYNFWYSPVLIARYAFCDQVAASARFEYYSDRNGVIIATGTPNGFGTFGYSLNVDYTPISFAMIRLEGRVLQSRQDEIFTKKDGSSTRLDPFIGATFALSFGYAPALIPVH